MQASLSHKQISVQAERWLASSGPPPDLSPADYLVFFMALHVVDSALTKELYEYCIERNRFAEQGTQFHAFHLIQTTVLALIQSSEEQHSLADKYWSELVHTYEKLGQLFDVDKLGILRWPKRLTSPTLSSITLQSFYVHETEHLIDLFVRRKQDYSSLLLELDILIFEGNRRLWDEAAGLYSPSKKAPETTPQNDIVPYLALWAKIPDQDQAEELLINLRSYAPPWTDPSSSAWLSSSTYLLYLGLLHYDMYRAARELKNYLERHLEAAEENWRTACISLCFAATSTS